MSSEDTTLESNANIERNKKRREKRKKHREKKELKSDIGSATERIQNIEKQLSEQKLHSYKSDRMESDSSMITRFVIELLLSMNLENKVVPDCYAFYKAKVYNDISEIKDEDNYFIYDGGHLEFHLINGKHTKIRFSNQRNELVYTFDDKVINYIFQENLWKVPNTIWSDNKGFGRGLKRKLCTLLNVSENDGYTMVFFSKDLELYKNKKSSLKVNLWKNVQVDFNLDEAFEKFKSNVEISEDGFISYEELSQYRDDTYKLKFNKLIENYFGDSVQRGFRKQNKRGFKGIIFKKN